MSESFDEDTQEFGAASPAFPADVEFRGGGGGGGNGRGGRGWGGGSGRGTDDSHSYAAASPMHGSSDQVATFEFDYGGFAASQELGGDYPSAEKTRGGGGSSSAGLKSAQVTTSVANINATPAGQLSSH